MLQGRALPRVGCGTFWGTQCSYGAQGTRPGSKEVLSKQRLNGWQVGAHPSRWGAGRVNWAYLWGLNTKSCQVLPEEVTRSRGDGKADRCHG